MKEKGTPDVRRSSSLGQPPELEGCYPSGRLEDAAEVGAGEPCRERDVAERLLARLRAAQSRASPAGADSHPPRSGGPREWHITTTQTNGAT